jgi:hypothetical protein
MANSHASGDVGTSRGRTPRAQHARLVRTREVRGLTATVGDRGGEHYSGPMLPPEEEPFETAWATAIARVGAQRRYEWVVALQATRGASARAYAGEPLTPPERALDFLGRAAGSNERYGISGAWCASCGARLPHGPRAPRLYRGDRCRRAASAAREAAV